MGEFAEFRRGVFALPAGFSVPLEITYFLVTEVAARCQGS
jgi:hypothetical protein